MVLLNGKEVTQEEFDAFILESQANAKLAEEVKNAKKTAKELQKALEDQNNKIEEGELAKSQLFKIKLDSRKNEINKWLDGKSNKEELLTKISNMDDSDFDIFKEGKTDTEYKTKEELEIETKKVNDEKINFEKNKEQIIKDAAKNIEKDKNPDEGVIPPTETVTEPDLESEKPKDTKVIDVEKLNSLYKLTSNPTLKTFVSKEMEDKANNYTEMTRQE